MRETQAYLREVGTRIRMRVVELRQKGVLTSKGEKMSMAAIGRTADPPVSRVTVYLVVDGKANSRNVREAVERELGQAYWIKRERKA